MTNHVINFKTPHFFTPIVGKKSPSGVVAKALVIIGSLADRYLSLGKFQFHAQKMEKIHIEGRVWKTTVKVASFVLTGFVLPLLALAAKKLYRNWALKGLVPSDIATITQTQGIGVTRFIQNEIKVEKDLDVIESTKITAAQNGDEVLIHIEKSDITDIDRKILELADKCTNNLSFEFMSFKSK